jgi:hypothetical protein
VKLKLAHGSPFSASSPSTLTFLCDQTLASGGQTDHDDAYPGIFHLNTDSIDFRAGPGPRGWEHEFALWGPRSAGSAGVRNGGVGDRFRWRHG